MISYLEDKKKTTMITDLLTSELLLKLEVHAKTKLRGINSIDPLDVVQEAITRILEKKRKWSAESGINFEAFAMKTVQSIASQERAKLIHTSNTENLEIGTFSEPMQDYDKAAIEKHLRAMDADQLEMDILECWYDRITKPQDIEDLLNVDLPSIKNAKKRLCRKLVKLRENL
jgi:DNA-directed RNA polymerase specialized sigma24 family protein